MGRKLRLNRILMLINLILNVLLICLVLHAINKIDTVSNESTPINVSTAPIIKLAETEDIQIVNNISYEDFKSIANVVSLEARGESYKGQCAVAQVIKNRCELWNKSVSDVINAQGQFAKGTAPVTDSVLKAVFEVFINDYSVVDEPITHFHTLDINPYWSKSKSVVTVEGNHIFYK